MNRATQERGIEFATPQGSRPKGVTPNAPIDKAKPTTKRRTLFFTTEHVCSRACRNCSAFTSYFLDLPLGEIGGVHGWCGRTHS